jgi:predicted  nucleic acid-binding Zn-ribbon protein
MTGTKQEISDLKKNIYGWKMRIMQLEEDLFVINKALEKRLDEFKGILEGQEETLKELSQDE